MSDYGMLSYGSKFALLMTGQPDFVQQFGEADPASGTGYTLSSQRQSIITSLLSAGTFFGAFFQSENYNLFKV